MHTAKHTTFSGQTIYLFKNKISLMHGKKIIEKNLLEIQLSLYDEKKKLKNIH